MRRICFVIPDPDAFQSGGNLYNAYLIDALRRWGVDVQVVDFEGFAKFKTGKDFCYFIDTLLLNYLDQSFSKLKNCFLIVHHLHSLELESPESSSFFKEYEWPILDKFDGFLVSSNFTKSYLSENGLSEKKFLVVEPALCFSPQPVLSSSPEIKAVLVANLIKRKGILPFLKDLRTREFNSENIQIEIIGSHDFEPEYAEKCQNLLVHPILSKIVKMSGPKNHRYIWQSLSEANLFISTSSMETFGMALQEAVAFRLPILAIDGGNAGSHVENQKNGFLFSSIEALVDKLEYLSLNEMAFKKLVKSAWNYRKKEIYNWEQAANLFVNQLNQNVG